MMRMFPHDEEWKTQPMESPHPSVDAALVQAVDTVARRLVMFRATPYDIRGTFSWTNFADVNEDDWERVEARASQLVKELDRGEGPFQAAYNLLKARAGQDLPRCICPRDPDDEDDPGDPISTCPIHGW